MQSTFEMTEAQKHLKQITEIRDMMERSSRFISLSGLSGVFAGVVAILGSLAAYWYLKIERAPIDLHNYLLDARGGYIQEAMLFLVADAAIVLTLALGFGIFFTTRRAKKKGLPIWDNQAKRLLTNLAIPLVVGGLFCLMLLLHHEIYLIAPTTLIFYGLALINASKYTVNDIRYLGFSEVLLGLLGSYFVGYGWISWVIGFGVLHILYGAWMYWRYER